MKSPLFVILLSIITYNSALLADKNCGDIDAGNQSHFNIHHDRVQPVSWWSKNSGAIVGSFFGAIFAAAVALMSIYFTHRNNIRLQNKAFQREQEHHEDLYCGNLFAIYHEINWHQNLLVRLRNELAIIREQTIANLRFPYTVAHELFRIEYLNSYRINTLEFERFDTDLLALVSTYMNLLMTINNNLHFEAAQNLRVDFESDQTFRDALNVYFDKLNDLLSRAELGMNDIQTGIVEVVGSFPGNQLTFEDNKWGSNEQQPNTRLEQTGNDG